MYTLDVDEVWRDVTMHFVIKMSGCSNNCLVQNHMHSWKVLVKLCRGAFWMKWFGPCTLEKRAEKIHNFQCFWPKLAKIRYYPLAFLSQILTKSLDSKCYPIQFYKYFSAYPNMVILLHLVQVHNLLDMIWFSFVWKQYSRVQVIKVWRHK